MDQIFIQLLLAIGGSVAQSSATGAALAIHKDWNKRPLPGNIIELKYYALTQ
jgi:CO dehydrogenase/acetyl-CoA synthase alpha subunit